MNRIAFSELAEDDLIDIWVHIAPDNETAADHLRPGARAFVHGNYLIVYRAMEYGIAVMRVAHGAQALELLEYPPPPPQDVERLAFSLSRTS